MCTLILTKLGHRCMVCRLNKPILNHPSGKTQWFMQTDSTWYLGTSGNLYLGPLLGISEPLGTFTHLYLNPPSGTLTGNCYLEPRNLFKPLLATFEPPGSFSWNPSLKPGNLHLKPSSCNLGTYWTLCLQPCLAPRNLPEPLLGTSKPRGTLRVTAPECPRA